jgi:anti-sigma regulatory factor (Ser/Thr protein kinase)
MSHNLTARFEEFLDQQSEHYNLSPSFLEQFRCELATDDYKFEAIAEISEIPFLRASLFWALQQLALAEEDASDLTLAFEESLANVLRHSYHKGEAKWLRFRLSRVENQISIELWDRGAGGRDPKLQERFASLVRDGRPPLQHRGGLGLYLMCRIMHELRYESSDTVNHLLMRKVCTTKE